MNEQDTLSPTHEKPYRSRKTIKNNPIFVKEMRGLVNQQRSRLVPTFYLIGLAVITFLLYITIISANTINPDPDVRRTLGKIIFLSIMLMQLIAIMFVAPLFSADLITVERENNTFDLLRITPVDSRSIVRGKLLTGVLYALLFLLISLPLQSSAYLLGGIALQEFLVSIVLLISTAIFLCSVSVWASTRSRRTSSAMGLANTLASVILVGLPILAYVIMKLAPFPSDQDIFTTIQTVSKNFDPTIQTIFILGVWLLISSNPLMTAIASYTLFQNEGVHVLYDLTAFKIQFPLLAPWITFVLLYLIISWLFYRSSVRQIKQSNKL